jgi:hypothetical protein
MKRFNLFGFGLGAVLSVALVGCGKSEKPTTTADSPAQLSKSTAAPEAERAAAMPVAADKMMADAAQSLASLQVPNLVEVSQAKLADTTAATLDQLATVSQNSNPQVASLVSSLKSSLDADKAIDALNRLPELVAAVKSVPGGEQTVASAKQMVSAWALKQNFDPALIAPALRALQTGDYSSLANEASKWVGTGELTAEQQQILQALLANYGLDLPATEMLKKVKGLF